MNIAIIEDIDDDYNQLCTAIDNFFSEFENGIINYTIQRYNNVNELYNNAYYIDLVFLDIECKLDINGIDIGIELRDIKSDILIVFISSYSQYLIEGYKAQANRYLEKPIKQLTFNVEMKTMIKKYLFKFSGVFDPNISLKKIYFKDIVYIEFSNRKTNIIFQDGSVLLTQYQLKEWLNILPKQFFGQVYRSIIVNYFFINGLKGNDIILMNNEKIPLSKKYKNEFKRRFIKFSHWRI